MNRRHFLGVVGAGALAACATTRPARRGPTLRLPAVRVAPEREIRTVVGLRPFRPGGFRVEAERLGDKLVVHDYGHGGGGVTLSWGTAELAARLVAASGATRVAVLGAGAVGLAVARVLQRRGAAVTIYAAELPPGTTSDVAGAQIFPFSVYEHGALLSPFREQFIEASTLSFRAWQMLVGRDYGVRWMVNYSASGHAFEESGLYGRESPIRDLLIDLADLPPGSHPFPRPFARRFMTLMVEPPVYLPAVLRDFRLDGGAVVVRRFASAQELASLPEPAIVNCTGLGAAALFGDATLVPVKGQLTVLVPQPEIDYAVLAGELYMFARRDGILLGGTFERGVWTLEPNLEAKARLLEGHARFFGAFGTSGERSPLDHSLAAL